MDITGAEEAPDTGRGDEMSDIMFGRGGVQARSEEEDDMDAFKKFSGL
jgi:hypothetical protein